ncbi:MAG: hypothetical protein A2Y21_07500 [Clostridiales bacterium GWC2_40_7]|nr:MAG: hypothetical protein A2Y21_07500 [Clostridiales bacterium GWC2_40_7]
MKFKLPYKNRKLYLKLFISLTLSIVLTMLILSTVLYVNFEGAASEQIYLASLKNLEQLSSEVSIMAKTALTISYQIHRDLNISKLLYYSQLDIFDLTPALTQLTNYRLSIPFIDSIYLYNGTTDTFFVESGNIANPGENSENFFDKQAVGLIKNHMKYKPYIPIPREKVNLDNDNTHKYYYTFLMYDMINRNNAVVVNIDETAWIHDVINDKSNTDGSSTFIMDSKGILVSDGKDFPMMSDFSGKEYIRNILKHANTSGHFAGTVNGIKSLVVYTKPDSFSWTYVRVIPWSEIFSKIEHIRFITIIISLGMLLFGIFVSLIISGRLYRPIGRILSNLENLEAEKRYNNSILKQEFLMDMALGRVISNKADLQKKYNNMDISIDMHSEICTLLFKIDGYSAFIQKYNIEDRNLYKFAIINIACEILGEFCKTEAVDIGKDIILIILDVSNADHEGLEISLTARLKRIQSALLQYFNISISITVSAIGKNIESLYQLYNQVLDSSLHRLFYGHGCIIYETKLMQLSSKEYTYPIQKEKLLINALMEGKMNEVGKIFDEIVGDTFQYPLFAYNFTISHLLFTLNNTINTIKNNNSAFDDFDFGISIIMLNEAETIDEIHSRFYGLFERVEARLNEKKNSKFENIIHRINEIINSEYFKPDLSIDSIAEALGMSSAYICRIYKQYTLHTILDDIVRTRMEKARKLLLETSCSIVEIAEKTGFSNSTYFYKAFKTANGVTPSEYRKKLK